MPTESDLDQYHPSYCDKYEVLRGIYPNDRRDTGKPCSCGFEEAVNKHTSEVELELLNMIVDSNMSKAQIKRLQSEQQALYNTEKGHSNE